VAEATGRSHRGNLVRHASRIVISSRVTGVTTVEDAGNVGGAPREAMAVEAAKVADFSHDPAAAGAERAVNASGR
jgi:hypothetical protein